MSGLCYARAMPAAQMRGRYNPFNAAALMSLFVICLFGWAMPARAGDSMQYDGRFSPKFPEAAKLQSIAVLPFAGTDGSDFAEALSAELRSAVLDGKPYFSVRTLEGLVIPGTASSAAKGRKGAAVSANQDKVDASYVAYAIAKGRELHVDGVYVGRVTVQSVIEEKSNKTNNVCTSGKLLHCKTSQAVNVACKVLTAEFSVVPKVIRVRDGEVLYSETVSRHASFSQCDDGVALPVPGGSLFDMLKKKSDNGVVPTTAAGLLIKVRSDAASEIRLAVAPYNKTVTVTFKKRAPDLSKLAQADFQNAAAFADGSRLDRACSMFTKLLTPATSNSVTLLYNLGVCEEALDPDEPQKAFAYYSKADDLLTRPDALVSAGIKRTQTMIGQGRMIDASMDQQRAAKRTRPQ